MRFAGVGIRTFFGTVWQAFPKTHPGPHFCHFWSALDPFGTPFGHFSANLWHPILQLNFQLISGAVPGHGGGVAQAWLGGGSLSGIPGMGIRKEDLIRLRQASGLARRIGAQRRTATVP